LCKFPVAGMFEFDLRPDRELYRVKIIGSFTIPSKIITRVRVRIIKKKKRNATVKSTKKL
jgi:hypothetical protein